MQFALAMRNSGRQNKELELTLEKFHSDYFATPSAEDDGCLWKQHKRLW